MAGDDHVVDEAVLGAAVVELVFGAPAIFETFERLHSAARVHPLPAAFIDDEKCVAMRAARQFNGARRGVEQEQRPFELLVGLDAFGERAGFVLGERGFDARGRVARAAICE